MFDLITAGRDQSIAMKHSTVVFTDSPLRSGMPIVPPVSAKVRLVAPREWSSPRTISAQSLQRNTDRRSTFCQINDKNML